MTMVAYFSDKKHGYHPCAMLILQSPLTMWNDYASCYSLQPKASGYFKFLKENGEHCGRLLLVGGQQWWWLRPILCLL